MKIMLQLLSWILNLLPRTKWKPIHLCHVYGKYGLNAPNLVGKTSAPTVVTDTTPSAIGNTTAIFDTNSISSTGGANATTVGVCWIAGTGTPTTSNTTSSTSGSFSTGNFSSTMNGLSPGTMYSVRAYAINSGGTGYGSTVTVTTTSQTSPTVVTNTTSGTTFTSSAPLLEFTGTDGESDRITYNIIIDNSIDGAPDSAIGSGLTVGSTSPTLGQSFQLSTAQSLSSIVFWMHKTDVSATGTITAKLYAHTGTYGSGGTGTGTPLATGSSYSVADLPLGAVATDTASYEPVLFTFSTPYSLTPSVPYVIALEASNLTVGFPRLAISTVATTHSGNASYINTGSWFAYPYDLIFSLGTTTNQVISATSGIDTGFTNTVTGTDTSPFISGQKIRYTAPSVLSNGTYQWRVRGLDPSGTAQHGAWSSVSSFTASNPPIVSQITPDASTVSSLTPQLKIAGTDSGSYDIAYQVQVDTASTFSSLGSVMDHDTAIAATQVTAWATSGTSSYGQTITPTANYNLAGIQLYMGRSGSPTDNINVTLNASPGGAVLSTADAIAASTVPASGGWVTFTFPTPYPLVSGTQYAIEVGRTGGFDATNRVGSYYTTDASYTGGTVILSGSPWTSSSNDLAFQTFATANPPLVSATSGVDAGFIDITNSSDTSPFASGDQIGYTIQAALANNTTYYWRARGIDPAGSNTYGAWSAVQSFTTAVSSGGTTGNIKVWNGSAWVAKPVKVWNGSAWVAKPVKVWNGTAWVVTNY